MCCSGRLTRAVLALCLLGACSPAGAQTKAAGRSAKSAPAWTEVKARVESQWKASPFKETVLNIETKSEASFYEQGRDNYWRQDTLVTVERANKTRARFTIPVIYKLVEGRWQFLETRVGEVEELPGADAPPIPSDPEAVRIFTEAWSKARPDFEVQSVEVLQKPKFHQSRGSYSLGYVLAVQVTGTRKGFRERYGKKFKCTPRDFSSLLNWDAQKKVWLADEKAIQNVNESALCEPVN